MKRSKLLLYLILLLFLFEANHFAQSMDQLPADNDVNVLIILPSGYGPNYFLIRDTFESFGWNVTTTSKTSSVSICHLFTALHDGDVYADESLTSLNARRLRRCISCFVGTIYCQPNGQYHFHSCRTYIVR